MDIVNKGHLELIKTIAKNNGLKDFKFESKCDSKKGDGYVSKIIKVSIKDQTKELRILLKLAPSSKQLREAINVRNVFLREIWMYETVLPTFDSFQVENGLLDGYKGFAKCFGTYKEEHNECLVLENLLSFSVWNRKISMLPDHIALVMKEFGKFHAVSFAIRTKKPTLFQSFIEQLKSLLDAQEKQEKDFSGLIKTASKHIRRALNGNEEMVKKFETLEKDLKSIITEMGGKDDYNVICQVDSWCNNMLFKYENRTKPQIPTEVCLIDWQMVKLGLNLTDISYFFFTSSQKDILYDYKKYLQIYYTSLSSNLKKMSCDPEKIYPYSVLEKHWNNYSRIFLFMAALSFPLQTVDDEGVGDVEAVESLEEFLENLTNINTVGEADERTRELMKFLMDEQLI